MLSYLSFHSFCSALLCQSSFFIFGLKSLSLKTVDISFQVRNFLLDISIWDFLQTPNLSHLPHSQTGSSYCFLFLLVALPLSLSLRITIPLVSPPLFSFPCLFMVLSISHPHPCLIPNLPPPWSSLQTLISWIH